jgi:hypothetical protein
MSRLGLVGENGMHSPMGASATPAPAPARESAPGTVYDRHLDPSSLFMRFDHQTGQLSDVFGVCATTRTTHGEF